MDEAQAWPGAQQKGPKHQRPLIDMASETAAAREIAKATGTSFGDDTIGVIMSKYDKDGNGRFGPEEFCTIVGGLHAEGKLPR